MKNILKLTIKSYNGKINTNFLNNKIPREGSQSICLSVILIDSVFRAGKKYYPQVFLEECKYVVKEKKIPKYIIDDIEISSDSDRENSDEENSDKETFAEETSDEENSYEESSDEEKKFFFFFVYIKVVNKYYQKNKVKLQKKSF